MQIISIAGIVAIAIAVAALCFSFSVASLHLKSSFLSIDGVYGVVFMVSSMMVCLCVV